MSGLVLDVYGVNSNSVLINADTLYLAFLLYNYRCYTYQ